MRTFAKWIVLLFLIVTSLYVAVLWRTNYSDLMNGTEKNKYFKTECTNACKDIHSNVADCVPLCEADMNKQWRSYDTCRRTMEPLSEEQRRMHYCFIDGPFMAMPPDGVPSPIDKASLLFLRPAAEAGSIWAQMRLGWIYESGVGIARNYALAIKWYEMAASQGDMWAQHSLGQMYHYGKYDGGVEKNYVKALKWYRLSAKQGGKLSQQHIGDMYKGGLGVERSDTEACFWYELAGLDYPQAKLARQNCVEILTPRQRLEVDSRKKAWNLLSQSSDR
jgi:hypothetical protein